MRVPVNVARLEAFAATSEAAVVPVRRRVQNNTLSYRDMINRFLQNVERLTPGAEMGSVIVRYEYKAQGRALVPGPRWRAEGSKEGAGRAQG